jgi:hypothetical protein
MDWEGRKSGVEDIEMSYSFKSVLDGGADSDMVYYNASLVATSVTNLAAQQPPREVRFNEARDAPIIKNASQYYFSIIRFAMNGPNKNIPLFIPVIQTNNFNYPVQNSPNLTIYYTATPYQREWYYTDTLGAIQSKIFTITPDSNPVIYRPEVRNRTIAPVPSVPAGGITRQDVKNPYYHVYTYKHWTDLVNTTMRFAMLSTYLNFQAAWLADPDIDQAVSPFPYPTFQDFLDDHDAPFLKYDEETKLFSIYGDTRAFNISGPLDGIDITSVENFGVNTPIPAFVPPAVPVAPSPAVPKSAPYLRLFFNTDLYNLFTSFKSVEYLQVGGGSIPFPLTVGPQPLNPQLTGAAPSLYSYEICFANQEYTNILNNNPTLQGLNAAPPPAYNPLFLIPAQKQNLYWISKQDYNSTNSLWSPCQSIVFTSNLLPVKNEFVSPPVELGESNTGNQTSSSTNAFQPIVSDFLVDQQQEKAEGWRDFVLYEPTAEYKMGSIQASHDEIRNIDVQVFWKYRLTGELIPLTMTNCSDVSIKILFRKVDYRS